jgi:hypothetical protein
MFSPVFYKTLFESFGRFFVAQTAKHMYCCVCSNQEHEQENKNENDMNMNMNMNINMKIKKYVNM